jgi:LysM repeat protein
MANFGFSAKDAVDSAVAKIKDPFDKYFRKPIDMKGALERNDYKEGFIITPYNRDGNKLTNDIVRLRGDMMPIVPFVYGGTQKLVSDYYPGNSEPTVQVLGPQEDEITINGRFKSKHFSTKIVGEGPDPELAELLRTVPLELQQQVETIRLNGFLVQLQLGEFSRWGFIKQAIFNLKTVADIEYKITFFIVGFNKPRDYIIVDKNAELPFSINKELISYAEDFQNNFGNVPPSMPKGLADQIKENLAAVAEAVNLVTGFVDTVLNEVDSVKDSISRAQGLIKNARNTMTTLMRRVGGIASFGTLVPTQGLSSSGYAGISRSYANSSYLANVLSSSFSMVAFLANLSKQLKQYSDKLPIARYRVAEGDTLQKIAIKFYKDSSKWSDIYDHNKLLNTTLGAGSILEIPRL